MLIQPRYHHTHLVDDRFELDHDAAFQGRFGGQFTLKVVCFSLLKLGGDLKFVGQRSHGQLRRDPLGLVVGRLAAHFVRHPEIVFLGEGMRMSLMR